MKMGWQRLATWFAGKAKLALIVPLTLAMAATAAADTVPQVTLATPGSAGTGDGTITRFTLRFSEDMVPLGDPRAPAPATHDCKLPADGRWVDTRTWVLEFEKPLPGGLSCHVQLRSDLTTARGVSVGGNDRFALDTGGPSARAVLAGGIYDGIEEDQIFLVATNVAADRASVGRFGYCAVDGIGEKIPLDVLPRETATEILTGLGDNNYSRQSFAYDAGLPQRLPAAGPDRDAALERIVPVKCRRPLPPAATWRSSGTRAFRRRASPRAPRGATSASITTSALPSPQRCRAAASIRRRAATRSRTSSSISRRPSHATPRSPRRSRPPTASS
ncbi:hypothetical protein [Sphingopyxis panaciterrae]